MSNKIRKKKKISGVQLKQRQPGADRQRSDLGETIQTALYFHQSGNLHQAEAFYLQVLAADPANPSANNLLGTLYYQVGQVNAARKLVEKAILASPSYSEAHNNLGNILNTIGDHEKAILCYRKALQYKPDYATAHNNLGIVLEITGRDQESLEAYRKALDLHPGYAEAHANKGFVLRKLGRLDDAVSAYCKALRLRPDFHEAYGNLSELLKFCLIFPGSAGTQLERKEILLQCLLRMDLEHQNFYHACCHELFQGEILDEVQLFLAEKDDAAGYHNSILHEVLMGLMTDQLMLLMLKKTVVASRLVEDLLTRLRRGLAMILASVEPDEQLCRQLTPFVVAFAQQCFWNEYVYKTTETEQQFLSKSIDQLMVADSFTSVTIPRLALLACYAPLKTYDITRRFPFASPTDDRDLSELVRVHFAEVEAEQALASRIPELAAVHDHISLQVKQQYEENPYPRWTGISLTQPRPFIECLQKEIAPNFPPGLVSIERPEVLVAGGGTGRQPITSAVAYLNSAVVAVDLSRASLAYAKRKADEFGITNLTFIEGDILDLHQLDRTFDVIECSGVLHHMGEPREGLRVLVDLLRPAGYMKIGLYSEVARRQISAAREFVKARGFSSTAEGIRAGRQAIFALPDDDPMKLITRGKDFYATSTVRDLIFHVQEHCFTLPEISTLLADFGLEMLGFTLGMEQKSAYLEAYGDDPAGVSLTDWHQFELEHPGFFIEMYNFWVRKKEQVAAVG
ncbi:MAG: tetratricopeptide repeat protein [Proteobacteria bacterium]|nr:tetratricopeptide repeat protein [Pseudomonadota bacterium]MBU1687822.1 tetratricopeptide repeat protein [Pseudomonadota bacterium]